MDREAFLARVRAATGGAAAEPAPTFLTPSGAGDRDAALERFAQRWRRPHAFCTQVAEADAAASVVRVLHGARAARIVLSGDPLLSDVALPQALAAAGVDVVDLPRSPESVHTSLPSVDAGVTVPTYVVAETATLVEVSRPAQPRTLSLLPPLHIAVVRAEAVLPTLDDLFAALATSPIEHTLSLISGPSGTADIEIQHVTGVHGPGEVHVIVLGGPRLL